MLSHQVRNPGREIVHRTRGRTHGAITRLVSPSDLGQLIKPFVFLDLAAFDGRLAPTPMGFGWHPHSGIATVTVMLEGAVRYAETTGRDGVLPAGGVEWMRASNGVWHTGAPEQGRVRAFQLWVALPPELENAQFASQYVMAKDVPVEGWAAVHEGVLRTPSPIPSGEIAIFEPSEESIAFVAEGATGFVLGSAAAHPHELVLGNYSVHTSTEALLRGERESRRVGQQLRAKGTI